LTTDAFLLREAGEERSAGCNGYIKKPGGLGTILAQIDKYYPGTDSARNMK